ncbi:adenylate/guanylate cyclase domain-containing protein [Photobacterium sp.]|uniref:adenylate/guanylate cyclase domain-containing protein n=1 Tax=Photobacterium sp. TaxID=660 RepID=UPI00299E76D0|nr:adenylate/guanylate cyclase domain-containing protein [Photobacterium sp.]MDX1301250.1 adenylate/guanylate cyclase domain-containing protein [Photobacterium sp.]
MGIEVYTDFVRSIFYLFFRGIPMGLLQKSLKARMTVYFLLVSVLVVVALAAVTYFLSAETQKEVAIAQFEVIADHKEFEINRFVSEQIAIATKIAGLDELRKAADSLLSKEFDSAQYQAAYLELAEVLFLSTFLDYGSASASDLTEILLLTNVGGRVFFSTDPSHEGQYRLSDQYFTKGRQGTYLRKVYPGAESGVPTLTVSTPLLSPAGELLGVLAAHIRLSVLVEIVSRRTGLGESGEAYLIDAHNRFISAERFGDESYPRGVHSVGIEAALKGENGAGFYDNYSNVPVIGSYRWLPDLGLALITEIEAATALAPANRLGGMILGVGLLAVGVLSIGIYLIAFRIARPILAVTDTTLKIAAGDLNQTAPVLTQDETGVLAKNFNIMIERLKSTLDDLAEEQEKSEHLLLNILPAPIAERLKHGEDTIADSFAEVSILFADIVNFTPMSAQLSAAELVGLLNEIFCEFDRLSELRGLEKIKTIGDAYMVGAGIPIPRDDHAQVVAEMALDMMEVIECFNRRHGSDLSMRIGINSGPVVAGVIGTKKFVYDIWGDAVNTASRMESQGLKGGIQVTEATHRHLRDQFVFSDRGMIGIKGKGKMHTYILKGRKEEAIS